MISDIQFVEFIITNIDYKVVSLEEDNEDNFEFAYGLKEVDDTYILSILTKVADVQGQICFFGRLRLGRQIKRECGKNKWKCYNVSLHKGINT